MSEPRPLRRPTWGIPVLAALLGLAAGSLHAESTAMPSAPDGVTETGAPSFVVLGPDAIGLSMAPTDLHLLPDGRILVVSQREIALGDGVRWEVYHGAKGQEAIYNQVAVDRAGRIYAGIEGGIARIDLGDDAHWRFTPVASLPTQDASIQSSSLVSVDMVDDHWFWHGGSGVIIAWQPGETARAVGKISSIERIFTLGAEVYVSEQSSGGLFQLSIADCTSRRVEAVDHLASETVTATAPFDTGRRLVGTSLAGLKVFNGVTFQPFGASELLGRNHRINDLCAVGDRLFAAAVDTVGIVVFDRAGRVVQVLDRALDLRLARVLRLQYAANGVLWALLNDGVVRMEFPSPVSHFEPLVPSGLAFAKPLRHAGRLWLLADGHAMRGVYDADGRLDRFEPDSPPGRFLFTLADVNGELFASTDEDIFLYENDRWKMIASGIVNARVCADRETPARLLYVARGELGFLQRTPAGFTTHRIPVPELGDNYNAVEDGAGIIWLELGTSRVARLDPHPAVSTLQIFGTKDGLSDGWVEIYQLDGVARFHLSDRLFRFDDATQRFTADRELLRRFPQFASAGGRPISDPAGRIWYTANGTAQVFEPGTAGAAGRARTVPVGFGPTQYNVEDNGQVVWMFENRRLVRLDRRITPPPRSALRALITSVQFSVSGRQFFPGGLDLAPIDYADNSLVIHFAAPANPFAVPVTFEVLLEGAGNQWVSTGAVGSAAFSRLKEGQYTFRVRPVAAGIPPGAESRLRFTVRPPWYRSPLAWVLYVVTAVGLVTFAAWFSSFLQRRENERLERVVTNRTRELNATNARLGRQIEETTEKSLALAASEDRFRTLNAELESRVAVRTAELSQSNDELQQRELLFRLIFEHAPVGISWMRADLGPVCHFNPTFRRTLELAADTLTDYAHLATLVHPDDRRGQEEMNRLIATGEADSYNLEGRFVLPSGRVVWGSLSVAVIRDGAGRIIQEIGILEDITARKQAEQKLADSTRNLLDVSRLAGMAEVATGVLHNVGNVLNSLNVSSAIIATGLRQSKAGSLAKVAVLLAEHAGDLATFLTADAKGRRVPELVASLARHGTELRDRLLDETASLQKNVDHIKEIVAMQQTYATRVGLLEPLDATTLMEDALRMNSGALARHEVAIVRDYQAVPPIAAEKGKVLQILVNLIRNAKYACDEGRPTEKILTLRVAPGAAGSVQLVVSDNGVGIPPENLDRIFNHGFTTRATGHGFGLHSSANAAREMKGSITVRSDGPGTGATFVLELPAAAAPSSDGDNGRALIRENPDAGALVAAGSAV